jgi:hypothetical protein
MNNYKMLVAVLSVFLLAACAEEAPEAPVEKMEAAIEQTGDMGNDMADEAGDMMDAAADEANAMAADVSDAVSEMATDAGDAANEMVEDGKDMGGDASDEAKAKLDKKLNEMMSE